MQKGRSVVIVSNDAANKHLNRLQVIPLTTSVERLYPSEADVIVRGKKHEASTHQLATVSKTRMQNRVGRISLPDMQSIERAVKTHLGLT